MHLLGEDFKKNHISLLSAESKNEELQIQYKVCYARVLDYRRKFIEAAQRYNELSYRTIIHESERQTALQNALHCTILASAGQQRSRVLALLFKVMIFDVWGVGGERKRNDQIKDFLA